jgi:hypothetical protein
MDSVCINPTKQQLAALLVQAAQEANGEFRKRRVRPLTGERVFLSANGSFEDRGRGRLTGTEGGNGTSVIGYAW